MTYIGCLLLNQDAKARLKDAGRPYGCRLCVAQIDVSKNQVRSVKKNFYKPPADLDFSNNRLKKLPAAKSKKKNYVHSIDVSHNALAKLPPNIDNLVCMTRLDLSNNHLQEVCVVCYGVLC